MFYLWVSADDAARGYAAAIIARAGAIVGAAGDDRRRPVRFVRRCARLSGRAGRMVVMSSRTVYVSIGRNIDGAPMSDDDWAAFRSDVVDVVGWVGQVVTAADGFGEYAGEREATFVVAAAADTVDGPAWRAFLASVRYLAGRYLQDAIAVSVAEPMFVGPGWRAESVDLDAGTYRDGAEDRLEGSLAAVYAAPPGDVNY